MGFPTPHSAVGVLTESRVSSSGRGQRRAESFWLISLLHVCKHLWTLQENRHVLSSPVRPIPCVVVYRRKSFITAQVHSVTSCFPPAAPRNGVARLAEGAPSLRGAAAEPSSRTQCSGPGGLLKQDAAAEDPLRLARLAIQPADAPQGRKALFKLSYSRAVPHQFIELSNKITSSRQDLFLAAPHPPHHHHHLFFFKGPIFCQFFLT